MKKTFLPFLLSLSFGASSYATTCEDIGAITETKQVVIDVGYPVAVGEPQQFCVLEKNMMLSSILASALLSKNPSLAATAYRTAPKPTDFSNMRGDRTYCKSLGGTYQYGKGLNGGWRTFENGAPTGDTDGLCVFADGSMISTWTLFYKRNGANSRPDFTPYFQNDIVPYPLW